MESSVSYSNNTGIKSNRVPETKGKSTNKLSHMDKHGSAHTCVSQTGSSMLYLPLLMSPSNLSCGEEEGEWAMGEKGADVYPFPNAPYQGF